MNLAWLKAHWYYVAGGLLGLLVIYELIQSLSGASSASSSASADVSGGANQLQALQASANLTDTQANAQVETASYAADVANNQTAAALQLGEVQTAAQLQYGLAQTNAQQNVQLGEASDVVEAQKVVTAGQVQETQIEGTTYQNLETTAVSVPLAEISQIGKQISAIQTYSKNAGADYSAFAPIVAAELGEQSAASSLGGSNASQVNTKTQTSGAITSQAISTGGSILTGLFAAGA